ncbi:hypothetical protein L7F22_041264 [Adiantum nelumboides]|nr:hypothetical protein [Adiantum nelumboides]
MKSYLLNELKGFIKDRQREDGLGQREDGVRLRRLSHVINPRGPCKRLPAPWNRKASLVGRGFLKRLSVDQGPALATAVRDAELGSFPLPNFPFAERERERETQKMQDSSFNPCGRAIVIMGVSGSGKSTVGHLLAQSLGCDFLDADDFHSQENKEKMKQGIPLTDSDRWPWLEALRDTLIDYILRGRTVVLACSALKPSYRQLLRTADYERMFETKTKGEENQDQPCLPNGSSKTRSSKSEGVHDNQQQLELKQNIVTFLLLNGPVELFASRLKTRFEGGAHFMPPSLLSSQMDSLAITANEKDIALLDANLNPATIVQQATGLVCHNA